MVWNGSLEVCWSRATRRLEGRKVIDCPWIQVKRPALVISTLRLGVREPGWCEGMRLSFKSKRQCTKKGSRASINAGCVLTWTTHQAC